jgi:hypothetical protein
MLMDSKGRAYLAGKGSVWSATGTSGANAAQTVSHAAEAGKTHVVTWYIVTTRGAAVGSNDVTVQIASGSTQKHADSIGAAATQASSPRCGASQIEIPMVEGAAANMVISAAGALCITDASFGGYTR